MGTLSEEDLELVAGGRFSALDYLRDTTLAKTLDGALGDLRLNDEIGAQCGSGGTIRYA